MSEGKLLVCSIAPSEIKTAAKSDARMKTEATLVAPTSLTAIRPFVSDLGEYQRWMPLVHKATTAGPGAWDVELRAKLGPFARSKRLRMERTTDSPQLIVFERREKDGREHAPWRMTCALIESHEEITLRVELFYGGALWTGGLLEKVLVDHIESGRENLMALITRSGR
jgi:hypothetical protein